MNDDNLVRMRETESYSWPLLTFLPLHFHCFRLLSAAENFVLVLGLYLSFQSQSVEIIVLMPLQLSESLLSLYLDEYEESRWDAQKYLNYGRHVRTRTNVF